MRVYDVEFFAGNKEYDYKVDAANGKVLSFDYDTERRTPATSSDYIGEAKAKQIVEKAAGTTGVYSSSNWSWMTAGRCTKANCAAAPWSTNSRLTR